MGKYIELTSDNFAQAKEGVALVDFWAHGVDLAECLLQ